MSNTRIALILLVLSESLGWLFGAWVFWQSKRDGKRMGLGVLFTIGFTVLGLAQLYGTFNSFQYAVEVSACIPSALAWKSLVSSGVRSGGAWIISLSAATTDAPGAIREWVNGVVERFR